MVFVAKRIINVVIK
ncbi:putative mannose-6-phosphate isomerase, partial [Vibrio parahaemolyticus V-223/04]